MVAFSHMGRVPEGYRGEGHETIGSDVLSILKVVAFPHMALGAELADELGRCQPEGWYPIGPLLEAMNRLELSVGRSGLMQMGRKLFRASHEARVKDVALTAADIIFGVNDMYRHANRGTDIGGWRVVQFSPGRARLLKNTPHHCAMEEGILLEALSVIGVPSMVKQNQCFRQGAPVCEYEVSSVITDQRWLGGRAVIG